MSNQSNIFGNQNIVIQDVSGSTITLNDNGKELTIGNSWQELKTFVEKNDKLIQIGEKIYNIDHIDQATFNNIISLKIKF